MTNVGNNGDGCIWGSYAVDVISDAGNAHPGCIRLGL